MSYTATEAAKLAEISYRQCDYWARTDLVTPSKCQAHGSGTRREYSYRDVIDLCIVKAMLDAGIYLPALRKVVRIVRSQPHLDLARTTLVFTSETVRLCDHSELVDVVRTERSMLSVLPLAGIMESLDNKLHRKVLVDAARR